MAAPTTQSACLMRLPNMAALLLGTTGPGRAAVLR
jgi:hypothetical protein